ncbi:TonB-dependent siderophore receptor [Oleiharenicola lentus]|uniref:TonB-dependent siderophore receptor n=1 Tax=Oleiharenicola lentus TaxID=2508720 RepID=UPI003F668B6B
MQSVVKSSLRLGALLFVTPLLWAQTAQTPSNSSSTTDDGVVRLDDFKVTDQRDAYKGNTSITGMKTDTPLIDVPAPIQVITKELIEDVGALDITDLYQFMGSVTEFSYGGVSARGFRQEQTRYNGIAGSPFNDFGILTLNNVEQVEVLKGPVGLLYGDNEPGGLINIVTAKPKAKFGGSVNARVGSYDLRGGSFSVTGPIDQKKRFLYLVSASYNEKESFRNNYGQEALNLVGSLTWVISEATRLNVEVEDVTNKQPGARIRGVPFLAFSAPGVLAPTGTKGGSFIAPISHSPTEPTDFQNLFTTIYSARLDHAFSSNLRLNAFVRWYESESEQAYHEGNLMVGPAFVEQLREFRHQLRLNDELAWAANVIGDYEIAKTTHKILAGVDYSSVNRVFYSVAVAQASVARINVLNPVYGVSGLTDDSVPFGAAVPNDTDKIRTGYYVQDQISFGEKWRLVLGARYEDFEDTRFRPTTDSFSDSVFTYRGAVGYKIQPNALAYYSYAMGLKPQTLGSEDQNGPFPPQESLSHEAGVKWDILQNRLSLTASIYDITKTNILERDPTPGAPTNWLAPIGEVTSRGFEFDASGQLTKSWNLSANYAYNDTKVTDAGTFGTAVGSRFPNAPRHKFGVWTRHNFLKDDKLGVAVGVNYVGARENFTGVQDFPAASYTIYNAALYYRWNQVRFALKCENIADKVYSRSVLGGEGHFPGTPRNYTFTTSYSF